MRRRLRLAGAAAVLLLASGCASDGGTGVDPGGALFEGVRVRVEPAKLVPEAKGLSRVAKVEVSDIRQTVHSERTTIGGISMGRIVTEPDEAEIVRALVQAIADAVLARLGLMTVPTIYCGLRVFAVETPATLLYWDVTARIDLVLRVSDEDRTASGIRVERTYLWPTQALIQGVTNEAVRELAGETEKALTELLVAR